MPTLESQIDELYQQPLDAFISARNGLAKTLSGADAVRVKKLPKPTVVPWAINQLFWKARLAWDRLLKSGEQLRKAQLGALAGRQADVRAAADAHRRAVGDAVKAAERLASGAGAHPPVDALMRAFEAVSLMSDRPATPGRLAEAPRPAGFEALAGTQVRQVRAVPKVRGVPKVREVPEVRDPRKEADARKREAAAAKKYEADVKKAEAALTRAKGAAATARDALRRAENIVAAAQVELSALKTQR